MAFARAHICFAASLVGLALALGRIVVSVRVGSSSTATSSTLARSSSRLFFMGGPATIPGAARCRGSASIRRSMRPGGATTGGLRPIPCGHRDGFGRRISHPVPRPRCQGRPLFRGLRYQCGVNWAQQNERRSRKQSFCQLALDQAADCSIVQTTHHLAPPIFYDLQKPFRARLMLLFDSLSFPSISF